MPNRVNQGMQSYTLAFMSQHPGEIFTGESLITHPDFSYQPVETPSNSMAAVASNAMARLAAAGNRTGVARKGRGAYAFMGHLDRGTYHIATDRPEPKVPSQLDLERLGLRTEAERQYLEGIVSGPRYDDSERYQKVGTARDGRLMIRDSQGRLYWAEEM